MDTLDLEKLFQRGYYVTLGATSSLLEVIQDPIKREENLKMLGRTFDEITQDLAEKGVSVEVEARSYVDSFIAQQVNGTEASKSSENGLTTVTTTAKTVYDNSVEATIEVGVKPDKVKASMRDEIQELTQQLSSLRSEIEQLRTK
jgi:polyhydroxyalkanoate synthesis regulator phasin